MMKRSIIAVVLLCSLAVTSFAESAHKGITMFSNLNKAIVLSSKDAEFSLQFESNPTTGYSWFLTDYNKALFTFVKHEFVAPKDKKRMGAPGHELWTFRANADFFMAPQMTKIHFTYQRPWEKESEKVLDVKISSVANKH